MFLVNQYLYLLLTREVSFESLQVALPKCVFKLMVWVVTVVAYSKTLNPMIFMTKEYFLARVHEEEMFIVQELVEMVEDWRYCKRLELRTKHEEMKQEARKKVS